jgi:hypothetical protein
LESTSAVGASETGDPLDGIVAWRLVRGLLSDNVELLLRDRAPHQQSGTAGALSLEGWRRRFTDPVSGAVPAVYRPGELTQSLCLPWQHDFRDCGCYYWASNHPDIVLAKTGWTTRSCRTGLPPIPGAPTRRSIGCVPTDHAALPQRRKTR